jgi:hypothetical protein
MTGYRSSEPGQTATQVGGCFSRGAMPIFSLPGRKKRVHFFQRRGQQPGLAGISRQRTKPERDELPLVRATGKGLNSGRGTTSAHPQHSLPPCRTLAPGVSSESLASTWSDGQPRAGCRPDPQRKPRNSPRCTRATGQGRRYSALPPF